MGLGVELEHGRGDPATNVSDGVELVVPPWLHWSLPVALPGSRWTGSPSGPASPPPWISSAAFAARLAPETDRACHQYQHRDDRRHR
jgi:hypothetical protein